jgi:tetrahydrodipicolinate N-succinyltransferase
VTSSSITYHPDFAVHKPYFSDHPELPARKLPYAQEKMPIIGNDVWIGEGVTILPGVTIGDGAVVGTGSVVTKSIAPYQLAAGNPARPIRYRFDFETRSLLQELKWWEYDLNEIREIGLEDPVKFAVELNKVHKQLKRLDAGRINVFEAIKALESA